MSRGSLLMCLWASGCLEPNPSFSPGSGTGIGTTSDTTTPVTSDGTGDGSTGLASSSDASDADETSTTEALDLAPSDSTTGSDAREPTDCPASAYVCEHFDDPAIVDMLATSEPAPTVTFIADAAAGAGALQFEYWETDGAFVVGEVSYSLPVDVGPFLYARFFARRSAATDTAGGFIQILTLSPSTALKRLSVDLQESNQPSVFLRPDDTEEFSTRAALDQAMVADAWVCLELEFELSMAAGNASLQVDGTPVLQTMQTYDTQFDDPITRVLFGVATDVPHELAVDELVVAPEPIGCWKDE